MYFLNYHTTYFVKTWHESSFLIKYSSNCKEITVVLQTRQVSAVTNQDWKHGYSVHVWVYSSPPPFCFSKLGIVRHDEECGSAPSQFSSVAPITEKAFDLQDGPLTLRKHTCMIIPWDLLQLESLQMVLHPPHLPFGGIYMNSVPLATFYVYGVFLLV